MTGEILVKYRVNNKKRNYLKLDRLVCDESQDVHEGGALGAQRGER